MSGGTLTSNPPRRRSWWIVALALVAAGCATTAPPPSIDPASPVAGAPSPPPSPEATTSRAAPTTTPGPTPVPHEPADDARLPPPDATFDYQLGGAYPPPAGVAVVGRDRTAPPAPGLYGICYVNGFQVQPGERAWWRANHPDLLLRDADGRLVIDRDWNEVMLDPRTEAKRQALAGVIGEWIAGCAADGFDAIEVDNLDTFTRSDGLIREDDAVALMRLYADAAHASGLPIAQKNSAEIVGRQREMGTDFAVAEECNRWDECDAYAGVYGDHVLVIEYRRRDFVEGCDAFPGLSIVLRDLDLVTPDDEDYVYAAC